MIGQPLFGEQSASDKLGLVGLFFLGELGLGVGFLQFRFECFDLLARQNAGVVAVFVVFLIGGGEERGKLSEAQTLLFHLSEQLGKLALQNIVVGNQFRSPAAGGDGFEVGLEIVHVAREGAAYLVVGEKFLALKGFGDARQKLAAQLVNVAFLAVVGSKCFDQRKIVLPSGI